MKGTMEILNRYDSGCLAEVKFSDCMKTGFVRYPEDGKSSEVELQIEQQPNMPLFITELPNGWREETGPIDCNIGTTRA